MGQSREYQFINSIVNAHSLSDSRLFSIAEQVNKEWRRVRYVLLTSGYVETTYETFLVASKVLKTSLAEVLSEGDCEWQDVDKYHLDRLIDGSRQDVVTYCMFQYPALGNFCAFYYKVKNKRVNDIMQESGYCLTVSYANDTVENLIMVREHMEMVKLMSTDDTIIAELEQEINALGGVISFIEVMEDLVVEVDGIFDGYIADTRYRLKQIKDKVSQKEYDEVREIEGNKIKSLADRFGEALVHLMCVSEN